MSIHRKYNAVPWQSQQRQSSWFGDESPPLWLCSSLYRIQQTRPACEDCLLQLCHRHKLLFGPRLRPPGSEDNYNQALQPPLQGPMTFVV
mmetsp:Transcript_11587/g.34497  ORF Transcript_11587/g.34497 Transcript_11587/m.34497 type:complete len:90 (-) Transcript_11587:463-732(-)